MVEVPAFLFDIDAILHHADFLSVGSNDLLQFMFAADRGNPRVASRYDALSAPALRCLKTVVDAGCRHNVPVTLCGEMAGNPLEAMALIGLGYRSISVAPASIGPVKAMILSLDAGRLAQRIESLMAAEADNMRSEIQRFAAEESVEI
jgi:phosphotransferase system enzyme I (PtsP)